MTIRGLALAALTLMLAAPVFAQDLERKRGRLIRNQGLALVDCDETEGYACDSVQLDFTAYEAYGRYAKQTATEVLKTKYLSQVIEVGGHTETTADGRRVLSVVRLYLPEPLVHEFPLQMFRVELGLLSDKPSVVLRSSSRSVRPRVPAIGVLEPALRVLGQLSRTVLLEGRLILDASDRPSALHVEKIRTGLPRQRWASWEGYKPESDYSPSSGAWFQLQPGEGWITGCDPDQPSVVVFESDKKPANGWIELAELQFPGPSTPNSGSLSGALGNLAKD